MNFIKSRWMHLSLVAVLAVVSLALVLLCLNRAPGMSDECWYALLHRDGVVQYGSGWNLILGFIPNSILLLRLMNLTMVLGSSVLLGLFVCCYCNVPIKVSQNFILPVLAVMAVQGPLIAVSYIQMTFFFFAASLSFLGWAYKKESKFLTAVAGALFFFIASVGLANFPLCGGLVLMLIWMRRGMGMGWLLDVLAFGIGVLVGAAVYFLIVQPPGEMVSCIAAAKAMSKGSTHSLFSLYLRTCDWIVYLITHIMIPAITVYACVCLIGSENKTTYKLIGVLSAGIALCPFFVWFKRILPFFEMEPMQFTIDPMWIWLVSLPLVIYLIKEDTSWLACALVALCLPFALSWGSTAGLSDRASVYVIPFAAMMWGVGVGQLPERLNSVWRGVFVLLILCHSIFSIREYWSTWTLPYGTHMTSNVMDDVTGYQLDSGIAGDLALLRSFVHKDDPMLVADRWGWGFAWLTGAKPLAYQFYFSADQASQSLAELDADSCKLLAETNNKEVNGWLRRNRDKYDIDKIIDLPGYPGYTLYGIKIHKQVSFR